MNQTKTIRTAIASQQAIFLRGLQGFVLALKELQLVGMALSPEEARQLCHIAHPELILLDVHHNLDAWKNCIFDLRQEVPTLHLVLFTDWQEECQIPAELQDLPVYCISRDVSEEEFRAAVLQILQNIARRGLPEEPPLSSFPHQPREEMVSEAEVTARLTEQPLPRSDSLLAREMVMAGKIQADILPEEPPIIPGWDIAARLLPAHETSGDFYDFIPLSPRKWGLLIADVTDKGMGAALFMALSSTLLRTYAVRFPTLPALTLDAVSERLLSDTRGSMYVTAFYAILETHTGRLVYANAGHPPAVLFSLRKGKESIEQLRPTGMALGVSEEARWRQKEVRLAPGDVLILYTDGITEAQNLQGAFFEEDRLMEAALAHAGGGARQILDGLMAEVNRFTGSAPRQDDIALIVIRREE